VTYAVFRTRLQVQYVVFPLLGWAAWRFEQRGAATAALLASGTAVWAAVQGIGPFEEGQLFQRMVTLQVFNVGIAFTSFVFAAVVIERRRAGEALRRAAVELEERIRERTSELSAANEQLSLEIGERKRAEEDVRTVGELLSQAEQIAHVGSWEWDIAGDRMTWSDELFRIFGLQPGEFDGTYRSFLDLFHPEDRDFADGVVGRALKERVDFQFDHRIVRPDGAEGTLRARGAVVLDASGDPVRVVGTAQDITEQRRAEETLRRFIANASHELRTPLTAVSALAHLLATKRHQLSEELFQEFLEALGHQGERARRLIVDLLDLSRAEQGQILARPVPMALGQAVGRVLRAAPPPQESSVDVDIPDDLVVLADPDILERALVNLLTNAYKYGGTSIRLSAHVWNERAQIVVADDGPGIPQEIVPHLFEPFTRGPVPSGTGTGLGLAIARSLAQSLAGEIHYEAGIPRGARFILSLPIATHGTPGDTSHPTVVAGTTEGAAISSERDQS
jgi:PAS domain S-box-containing protein